MQLRNTLVHGLNGAKSITITDGIISAIGNEEDVDDASDSFCIRFTDAVVFPGLINSHDHLDFNLFPPLGNGIYKNYIDWGHDVQATKKMIIDNVLKIPLSLRTRWGVYKNLLNGFTAVVNHGQKLEMDDSLIAVFQDCFSLHSPAFEKNWKRKILRLSKRRRTVAIHIGEGTDEGTTKEISRFSRWNIFRKPVVGIHGVAMQEAQATFFRALVWCPASNHFMLNRTANVEKLKLHTALLFGTDSTLTAEWNSWNHFRLALASGKISAGELLQSLTITPAKIWNMGNTGAVEKNRRADLVVAKMKKTGENNPAEIFSLNPADLLLVIRGGRILLFDESIRQQLDRKELKMEAFSRIRIEEENKYVYGDLPALMEEIRKYYPQADFPVSAA